MVAEGASVAIASRQSQTLEQTAAELSQAADEGIYFRTAPSDELQGAALANVLMRDGVGRVAIVARGDAYGEGLQGNTRESLERAGMPIEDILRLIGGGDLRDALDRRREALERERPGLPVLLTTGYSDQITASGTSGRPVLLKPYRLETLAAALNEALSDNG